MTDHNVIDNYYSCCLPLSWVVFETAHVSCMHVTHPSMTFWKKLILSVSFWRVLNILDLLHHLWVAEPEKMLSSSLAFTG